MARRLLIPVGILVVILVTAVLYLGSNLDSIVKKSITKLGSDMTGVSVTVDKVEIALADRRGEIGGLVVDNPRGYKGPHAFQLGSIVLTLGSAAEGSDPVVIRELTIEAPDIVYDKGEKGSNIEAIQRNVDEYAKANFTGDGAKDMPKDTDKASAKRFIIESLQVRGGKIQLVGREKVIDLPTVRMRDVGKSRGGMTGGEIAGIVLKQHRGDGGLGGPRARPGSGRAAERRRQRRHQGPSPTGPLSEVDLDHRPGPDDSPLGHHDDAAPDVPAVAVGFLHTVLIHQPAPIADARVLVDDRAVDDDVVADAQAGPRPQPGPVVVGLVEVGADEHRARDGRALADDCPNADHRLAKVAARQRAPVAEHAVIDPSAEDACRRQVAWSGEDRPLRIVEAKGRIGTRQHDVGVVVGLDGSHIGPVVAVEERVHPILAERRRNDLLAKVDAVLLEHLEQRVAREDVDAHRRDKGLVVRRPQEHRA